MNKCFPLVQGAFTHANPLKIISASFLFASPTPLQTKTASPAKSWLALGLDVLAVNYVQLIFNIPH